MKHGLLLLAIFLASGCGMFASNNVQVTVYSDPPGASLYANQTFFGYTPVVLNYNVRADMNRLGCVNVQPLKVRWISGAEAAISSLKLCQTIGNYQQYTFIRPTGVAGIELDSQYAIEQQRNAILAQQAQAQSDMARTQAIQALGSVLEESLPQQKPIQDSIRCTSENVFGKIITNCR